MPALFRDPVVPENYYRLGGVRTPIAFIGIGDPVTGGTVGSVLFVGTGPVLAQDNANFFWDDTNNRFLIGPAISALAGVQQLTTESSTSGLFQGYRVANTPAGAGFTFGHARGTIGSELTLAAFDALGGLDFRGHDGTSYTGARSAIAAFTTEAWTASAQGAAVTFQTTPNGTTTISPRLTITDQGNILIATSVTLDPTTGDSALIFADSVIPAGMAANTAGIFADDIGGNVNMFAIDEAGAATQLTPNFIALGGGAAPVVGTIGGAGPAVAAQNSWMRIQTSGVNIFIPIWV